MLPIKIYLQEDTNNIDGSEFILNWMKNNRSKVHDTVLEAAKQFVKMPTLKTISILEIYSLDDPKNIIAEIDVEYAELLKALDECIDWYVKVEQYEKAAECK